MDNPCVRKVVIVILSNIKNSQIKKCGKLPAKVAEEIPWNNIFVDIIVAYALCINRKNERLNLKVVTMVDPITGYFEIVEYNNECVISLSNLVKTKWLTRYPWTT